MEYCIILKVAWETDLHGLVLGLFFELDLTDEKFNLNFP